MRIHETVLAKEAVEALRLFPDAMVVDATVGAGGHARSILSTLGTRGTFIGIDADNTAIEVLEQTLKGEAAIHLRVGNFRDIDSILNDLGVGVGQVHAILADLGWRMEQFSGNGKGFSFLIDEPLVMTYGNPDAYPCTARDIINSWNERDIANVLLGYGEERYARRIARHIALVRETRPIETTFDLVEVVRAAVPVPYLHSRIHPATRTFQALRIAVNDELSVLTNFIHAALGRLAPQGRLAIISFHSLEDRIVKHTFREAAQEGRGTVVTKRPIIPAPEETEKNPRARSAKLRIFETYDTHTYTQTTRG